MVRIQSAAAASNPRLRAPPYPGVACWMTSAPESRATDSHSASAAGVITSISVLRPRPLVTCRSAGRSSFRLGPSPFAGSTTVRSIPLDRLRHTRIRTAAISYQPFSMETIDVAGIRRGVTRRAVARAVAQRALSVCVLERHARPGLDTSTHNSGVIHAGIYYPADSLKARLCTEGRRLLYAFCAEHHVPHKRCGKLIVAHDNSELGALDALWKRGTANGVERLELVDRAFIARREPSIEAVAGIYSPESGSVEAEELV